MIGSLGALKQKLFYDDIIQDGGENYKIDNHDNNYSHSLAQICITIFCNLKFCH